MDEHQRAALLGQIIAEQLHSHGWTQTQFARLSGLSQQSVSAYVKGRLRELPVVPILEDALGLRRGELLVRAGYVETVSVVDAILADPWLPGHAKETMLSIYGTFAPKSGSSGGGGGGSGTVID